MIHISSLLGCRNCIQGNGIRHIYVLQDGIPHIFKEKTEYEVMTLLEKWRAEDNKLCTFCGSSNVEVYDVEIDGYPLYDQKNIVARCKPYLDYLFILDIDKEESLISMKIGGSKELPSDFLKSALKKVISTLDERPNDNFHPQPKGNFFISISTNFDNSGNNHLKLERFKNIGLTRGEILNKITPLAQQLKINVNDSKNSLIDNSPFQQSNKDSILTSWFNKITKKFKS